MSRTNATPKELSSMTRFNPRSLWKVVPVLMLTVLMSARPRPVSAGEVPAHGFAQSPHESAPQTAEKLSLFNVKGFRLISDFTPSQYRGTSRTPAISARQFQLGADFVGLHFTADVIDTDLLAPHHPLARPNALPLGQRFNGSMELNALPLGSLSRYKGTDALSSQQFALSGKTFTFTYGHLSVGKIAAPDLVAKSVAAVNRQFADRGKFGPNPTPILSLQNVAALNGLRESDFGFRFAPSKSVGLEMEQANVQMGLHKLHFADQALNIGTFRLTRKLREVSPAFSDAALDAMGRSDLKALKGTKSEEINATWNPSKALSFSHYTKQDLINRTGNLAAAREVRVRKDAFAYTPNRSTAIQWAKQSFSTAMHRRPEGTSADEWKLQTLDVKIGNFSLHRKEQSTSYRFADPLLDQLGRPDLKPLKGLDTKETTINWKISQSFSFAHYSKDELVNRTGNLAQATQTHYDRNVFTFALSKRTLLQFTDERTKFGAAQPAPGQSLNELRARTLFLSQKLAPKSGAMFSLTQRHFNHTVNGAPVTGSERLFHFDTGKQKMLSLSGDFNSMGMTDGNWYKLFRLTYQVKPMKQLSVAGSLLDHTSNATSQKVNNYTINYALDKTRSIAITNTHQESTSGAVRTRNASKTMTITPAKNIKMEIASAHVFAPNVPDTQTKRFALSYQMDRVRSLTLSKNEQAVRVGANVVTHAQTVLALTPARDMKLELINSEQKTHGAGIEMQQVTLRKQLSKSLAIALRNTAWEQSGQEGESNFGMYLERKGKHYNWQFGQELLRNAQGQFTPSTYLKLQAQPAKNWSVNLALADQNALVNNLVAPRGWEIKGVLGKATLEARNWVSKVPVPNQPNLFHIADEQVFSLRLPFSKRFQFSASMIDRYNMSTKIGTSETVFALTDNPGGVSDWGIKFIKGAQVNGLSRVNTDAIEMNFRRTLSEENKFGITARVGHSGALTKSEANIYVELRKVW
ncbi:MAG: hypothetical protein NZT92_12630 [Abditibacteriales bacterium]|nr:hypothetical protein [Abditibacteriales bacterium]MDW8366800.1 hypothetical protein [Abditibacteriales bacterium]